MDWPLNLPQGPSAGGGVTCQQRLSEKGVEEEVGAEWHSLGLWSCLCVPILHAAQLLLQAANALPLLLDQRS